MSRERRDALLAAASGAAFAAFLVVELLGIWASDQQLKETGWVILVLAAAIIVSSMLVVREDKA